VASILGHLLIFTYYRFVLYQTKLPSTPRWYRGQRTKEPRAEPKGSEVGVLLARDEHETAAATPEVDRVPADAIQPPTVITVLNAEHAEVAIGVRDGLHSDDEPLTVRLVLVLQSQLGTDFGWAELKPELLGSLVDVLTSGSVLETELGDGDDHEVHFGLLGARREGGLTEDVIAPIANTVSVVFESTAEVVGGLETCAELEALPDSELSGVLGTDDELTADEAVNAVFAAENVPDRLNAVYRRVVLRHLVLLAHIGH
jgi:hypothetical protein